MRCHICEEPMQLEIGDGFETWGGDAAPTIVWFCPGCGLWVPAPTWVPPAPSV